MRKRWELSGKSVVILLAGFLLAASCRSAESNSTEPTAVPAINQNATLVTTAVSTATSTPNPTNTPAPTQTATPTLTPTATAVPVTTAGDPRATIIAQPEPQGNAVCGVVDLLDFPLDPPDALNVRYGGEGFGRFRSRYDQYHAGEDWQLTRGRSNLGVPVYAIGHGRVTYAQPFGWGRDQGVIIVRHTFANGSTVLSFYGHMDPDSVTLRAGDCVTRGQKIAEIGQPRTPPHLHFEIRTHMPDEPGPGYWPDDPTEAGWLPPSQFIWNNRIAAVPGVVWTRPYTAEGTQYVAVLNEDTLIVLEEGQLIGLDLSTGSLRWQRMMTETVANAIMDTGHSSLYLAGRQGQVAAYSLLAAEEGTASLSADPLWSVDLEMIGSPDLLPLPDGGVAVSVRQDLAAVSAAGAVLWQAELAQRPFAWLLTDDQLILTVADREGPIYSLTTSGIQEWPVAMNGRPVRVGNQIWLYTHDGLYRLDPASLTVELLYQLPQSFLGLGSILALPGGGVLIAHRERDDNRLLAFNPSGALQWQRSYAQLESDVSRLFLHKNQPYLLIQSGTDVSTQINLYEVDVQNSVLTHIFSGGTRTFNPSGTWVVSVNDDLLLINIGGGSMAAFDPQAAN